MEPIRYALEPQLDPEEFRDLLIRSTLAERRPVDEPERLAAMCRHTSLMLTARHEGLLVGLARSLSDFVYCTYLSDLAVDAAWQRRGIGRRLIAETKRQAPQATLILLAAPRAQDYYPGIGMSRFEHCYLLRELGDLRI